MDFENVTDYSQLVSSLRRQYCCRHELNEAEWLVWFLLDSKFVTGITISDIANSRILGLTDKKVKQIRKSLRTEVKFELCA